MQPMVEDQPFFLQFDRSIHLAATISRLQSFSSSPKIAGMFQTGPTRMFFYKPNLLAEKNIQTKTQNDFNSWWFQSV